MVIGSRQTLLKESHNEINIKLEDQITSKVDHAKSLGLIIDNRLSWSNHVKVAEHSFGSLKVYVICQIIARERLQLTSWNLASEKYTDKRFW